MITDRDERALRTWLDDEPPVLPTQVWYAVMSEIPTTRQRRRRLFAFLDDRPVLRLAAAAVLLLVVLGALVIGAGAAGLLRQAPPPRPFQGGEVPLEPGHYVIHESFPMLVGLDVPEGWIGVDHGRDLAVLTRDRAIGPTVLITQVDGVYRDACDPDAGLQTGTGATGAALARAIAGVASVSATTPSGAQVGDRAATGVSIQAPSGRAACTTNPDEPPYQLWGLPSAFGLRPGQRAEIAVVEVGDQRLVVVGVSPPGTDPADAAAARAIIASLRFGVDEPVPSDPAPSGSASPPDLPMATIRPGMTLEAQPYRDPVQLYAAGDTAGVPLPNHIDLSVQAPDGWKGTLRGLESADGDASIEVWSIGAIHPDPCRWRTSRLDVTGADLAELAQALGTGWATTSRSTTPEVSALTDPPWNAGPAWLVEMTLPSDLDASACDGGTYRLWEDRDGTARTGRPGERIELRFSDLDPGLVAVAFGSDERASLATLDAARVAGMTVTVLDPVDFGQTPAP